MPPKQATLGYVRPAQTRLGKFFGKRDPPVQQKLALSPRKRHAQLNASGEIGEGKDGVIDDEGKQRSDVASDTSPSKKRPHSPAPAPKRTADKGSGSIKAEESGEDGLHDESDEGPIAKRPKRTPTASSDIDDAASEGSEDVKPAMRRPNGTTPLSKNKPAKVKAKALERKPKLKVKEESEEESDAVPNKEGKGSSPATNDSPAESESEMIDEEPDSEDEGIKPEAAEKARETVQTLLESKSKDPYPDWKPGEPVPYAALCTTFALIESTTKRLIILSHCSLFLRQVLRLTPEDLLPTVLLMINKLAADYAGVELGIGESLIMKAIGESTGRSLAVIKADQNEIGDLGLVAAKSRSNQPTMFKPKALTVRGVRDGLMAIATTQGNGAQTRKIAGIKKLLSAADAHSAGKGKGVDITKDKGGASESKFIVRTLEGKMRLGLADRTVLVALAQAMVVHEISKEGKVPTTEQLERGETILKTVYSELPSYEVIVPAMLEHGIFNLEEHCKLQPGVPLKPMLAKPTKAITEVLDRFENKNFTCEYKYDGERSQIHFVSPDSQHQYLSSVPSVKSEKGISAIFSRNSEDLSKKYPDILAKLDHWVKDGTKSFVLDCETVGWDLVEKKVLPFQQLMTRKRKDVKVEDVKVKVCVFAFDLLFLNGEPTVKKSLRERREMMKQTFEEVEGEFGFAKCMNTSDLDEIQTFLDESVKASCEGLMVKMLDGEESGYEPSKRSRNWLKVKKDYLSGLGDSLDLVVLGAYYGKGKRTSLYGAFLLSAYNPTTETYETICNLGTGFTDPVLQHLHALLSPSAIPSPPSYYSHSPVPAHQPDVWFPPKHVWEVKAADLTLSPRYRAAEGYLDGVEGKGVSLRFPRFLREREDKKPEDATRVRDVAEMYRRQEGVSKGKDGGGGGGGGVDDDFEY
ncbi:hypothetical protein GP486_004129 [Trichoglossum hirsutum]|uniref:DNA ligase 1 n=1 Tax=Trichoglossum hirsutum TaxID=265104 RepID=A0A9P8LBR4_9PEZI|nr:hypothetical protein GP486_004129 [Trichoglossum hirsutum]